MKKTKATILQKFLLLILMINFQSCSMCSQKRTGTTPTSAKDIRPDKQERQWCSLTDIGYPVLADSIPSIILERYCYSVSYNKETRLPNWVMWKLTGEHVMKKKEGTWSEYREDLELPADIRATLEDYASSGYDRGHMCPGSDCNWSDVGRDETFLLSNMCPQNPNLNRGDWKEIEIACRKWAQEFGSVYIVCGPLFLKSQVHELIGPNQIPVPEAFFKVVLCPESPSPRGIGFICRNTDGNRKKDFYVNTIRQVERITGYRFFPNLDDSTKAAVYDMDNINDW